MKLLAALVSVLVAGLCGATAASAASLSGSIAMYSDPGDYIGQGQQQVWSHTATGVTGNPGDLTVNVSDSNGNAWDLEFAAPPGQVLQPGVYDHALRAPFRGSSPGIDINGAGRGCNTDAGRFEVKDVAFDSSGNPTRLWIIFEQHCEGAPAALFGEVRLGEGADGASAQSAPSVVRWPVNDFGTPETVVPVQFSASQATSVTGVSITGADPADFRLSSDGCSGVNLAVGRVCTVYVGFTPTAPGLQTATLQLSESGGATDQVPLQGWTYGGTTRLVMNSDAGDYIGQGESYSYSPASATLDASGTPQHFSFAVQGSNGDWWNGAFSPSQGQIFTTGSTWTNVARDSFRGSAAGMDVNGDGRGCNTVSGQFQVISATYDPDGVMQTFAVKFEQHCEGAQPALRGEFDWRLNDHTPPAPWMQGDGGASGAGSGGSSGAGSSGGSSAVAGAALLTLRSIPRRVLVSSLVALLARQSRREARALALFARAPRAGRHRRQALSAINRLMSALVTARHDLSSPAMPTSARVSRRRLLTALAAWRTALTRQRAAIRSTSHLNMPLVRRLNRQEAARASVALRVLRLYRETM